MPGWAGSDRRQRLPDDWRAIRKRVLRRDQYRCTHHNEDGVRCPEFATDVDHISPGDDNRETNLASLCQVHHQRKSSHEGGAASAAKRGEIAKRFTRSEVHPGEIG